MDNRSSEQIETDCDALARRVSEALDGAELTDVASVASGITAFAIRQYYEDMDARAAAMVATVQSMFRVAGFACDVDIKVQRDALH